MPQKPNRLPRMRENPRTGSGIPPLFSALVTRALALKASLISTIFANHGTSVYILISERWQPSLQNKYQLSQMDPRDGIVPQTELDDHGDKLAVDRCKYCQLS